jgi:hypothetical protein
MSPMLNSSCRSNRVSRSFLLSVLIAWLVAGLLFYWLDTRLAATYSRGTHARSPARALITRIAILYWGASWTC